MTRACKNQLYSNICVFTFQKLMKSLSKKLTDMKMSCYMSPCPVLEIVFV